IGPRDLEALCAVYRGTSGSRWLLFQCLHGAGHGLDMHFGHALGPALAACAGLSDSWERESCFGGAFMENLMHAIEPQHPASRLAAAHHIEAGERAIDPLDPLYPCSVVASTYRKSCYLLQTSAI